MKRPVCDLCRDRAATVIQPRGWRHCSRCALNLHRNVCQDAACACDMELLPVGGAA